MHLLLTAIPFATRCLRLKKQRSAQQLHAEENAAGKRGVSKVPHIGSRNSPGIQHQQKGDHKPE